MATIFMYMYTFSELSAEVTSLKKDKSSLQDEIREIRADSDRKLRRQTDQFKETQTAERKLEQVIVTSKHPNATGTFLLLQFQC